MGTMANITLEDIIQRKIQYCENDRDQELKDMNAGYVRGYRQMLLDMHLTEGDFVAKYSGIVKNLKSAFEDATCDDELCGYNNAIVDVLCLLDNKYLFDESI